MSTPTPEEIDEWEAGKELDLAIAEHVFGIRKIYYSDYDTEKLWPQYIPSGKPWRTHMIDAKPLPRFSTDIAAAFEIIKHEKMDWEYSVSIHHTIPISSILNGWLVGFERSVHPPDYRAENRNAVWAIAEGLPLAICRAALKAKFGQEK